MTSDTERLAEIRERLTRSCCGAAPYYRPDVRDLLGIIERLTAERDALRQAVSECIKVTTVLACNPKYIPPYGWVFDAIYVEQLKDAIHRILGPYDPVTKESTDGK